MSQKNSVLEHLKRGNKITPLEALNKFGCFRLASIIFKLKQDGHVIEPRTITKGNKTFAEYKLITREKNGQLCL